MTMHLERGPDPPNTTKRKKKQKSDAFYVDGWREHNKFLKKMKLDKMTLQEYIDYVQGKYVSKSKPAVFNFEWNARGGYFSQTRKTYSVESANIVLLLLLRKKQCITQVNVNLLELQ